MKVADCFADLAARWQQELVVCALGTSSREWYAATGSDRPFYMLSSMGLASSFGMGLALGLPREHVWVFDGDGGLTVNLSTLLTEASQQPPNLVHFVLSNRVYQVIGRHPLSHAARADYAAIARGAGVEHAYCFDDLTIFRREIDGILAAGHFAFVVLEVEPETRPIPHIPWEGPEIKYRFGRHIEQQAGVSVFGPAGY
ncbi:MAG TPA: thiamine pyrophosphate-dependent enzyme [Chloroflexota bacterium]|jgi:thiamine pyrophosphate-dependent acetolactate synthase large subunit-like protein